MTELRYFIERGTWDPSIEVFLDSDGEPSQFAVRIPFFTVGWHKLTQEQSIPSAAWFVLVSEFYPLIPRWRLFIPW